MLTSRERKGLETLLAHAVNPDEAMNIDQLEGYLFGIVMTPDTTHPSEWFVDIFGENLAEFEEAEEANAKFAVLKDTYNRLNTLRLEGSLRFPFDLAMLDQSMLDRLRDWAVGLDRALALRSYIWVPEEALEQEEVPEDVEEVMTCLMVVLGVAHPEKIPEIFEGTEEGAADEPGEWARLISSLPLAVKSLLAHAEDLEARRLAGSAVSPASAGSKPGRNDPCPCGSGRKYKRCCGLN